MIYGILIGFIQVFIFVFVVKFMISYIKKLYAILALILLRSNMHPMKKFCVSFLAIPLTIVVIAEAFVVVAYLIDAIAGFPGMFYGIATLNLPIILPRMLLLIGVVEFLECTVYGYGHFIAKLYHTQYKIAHTFKRI